MRKPGLIRVCVCVCVCVNPMCASSIVRCTHQALEKSPAPFLLALVYDHHFTASAGSLSSLRFGIRLGLHPIRRAWAWSVQLSQ